MARDTEWYARMGDIPGLEFASPGIDRTRLRGHDATPELRVYEFDGQRRESLSWRTADGETSGSPAQAHAQNEDQDAPAEQVLKQLYEALELPGQPADYHFVIQDAAGVLWNRRRDEPNVVAKAEELYLLDIRLVEACPQAVSYEGTDGETYYSITAFYSLISLYEREGFIREALAILGRSKRFGRQVEGEQERLEAKLLSIETEGRR